MLKKFDNTYLIFPLLLVLYEICAYLSNDMYLPALPNIMADLQTTEEKAQLTLTYWFLGSASMQLVLGPVSDRYGRRPVLLISGFIYILTNIICALTTDISVLLFIRFTQGIMTSAVVVAGYASIHELYDQTNAIRILALMGSIIIIAPAFGPLIGSIILQFVNWRWIFWIIAILSSMVLLCLIKWMPESHPRENRQPTNLRSLIKSYYSIISNWKFSSLSLAFGFTFCGFIAWLTAGPFIVVNEFKHSVVTFGVLQTIVFACYITSNNLVKKYMEKYGINKLIHIGLFITLLGGVIAAIMSVTFPNFLTGLIIGMAIFSFGSGFCFAPLSRLAIEASPEPMGMRMAVFSTFMTGAGVIGSLLGSVFYNGTISSLGYVLASVSLMAVIFKLGAGKSHHFTN